MGIKGIQIGETEIRSCAGYDGSWVLILKAAFCRVGEPETDATELTQIN